MHGRETKFENKKLKKKQKYKGYTLSKKKLLIAELFSNDTIKQLLIRDILKELIHHLPERVQARSANLQHQQQRKGCLTQNTGD